MNNSRATGERAADRFLRLPTVRDRVGVSKSSIYQWISEGTFPRPIPLGGRAVGWIESEVDDWMNRRIEASRNRDGDTTGRLS